METIVNAALPVLAGMVMANSMFGINDNDAQVTQALEDGYIPVDTETYTKFFQDKIRLNSVTNKFYAYTEPESYAVIRKFKAKKAAKLSDLKQYLVDTDFKPRERDDGYITRTQYDIFAAAANIWRKALKTISAAENIEEVDAVIYETVDAVKARADALEAEK